MANYFKTGFILLLISAVSAGLLAVVNGMTVDVIAQAEFEKSVEAYQEIYGDKADTFEPIDEAKKAALVEKYGDIQDVFVAKKEAVDCDFTDFKKDFLNVLKRQRKVKN